jgi:hypothetical protein
LGVTGTITMKMIKSTNKTSIIGVTLMSHIAPPLLPVVIAMAKILDFYRRNYLVCCSKLVH